MGPVRCGPRINDGCSISDEIEISGNYFMHIGFELDVPLYISYPLQATSKIINPYSRPVVTKAQKSETKQKNI